MEKDGVWRESVRISASMVNLNKQIRLTALCNFLQEIAGNHARFLGMGYQGMQERGQFWALSRIKLEMQTFPLWLEDIHIHSWVSSIKGPFSHRNFLMLREDGTELGSASSLWALLSGENRRPSRIQNHTFTVLEEKLPACGLPPKLPNIQDGALLRTHEVVFSDLDMIGHVNNGKYVEWITDAVTTDRSSWEAYDLIINYLQETVAAESVDIYGLAQDSYHLYELKKTDQDQPVCRAKIRWRKRS
ncbi:MAG: acyl-ACP thioesterase domain-containing protein [Bacteroidota bacterium]